MDTTCSLRWRDGDFERVWCTNPGHPIAERRAALLFELETEEMYGEFFDVPQPTRWSSPAGSAAASIPPGCCWHRGAGKVFYFQPGHETNTGFKNPHVLRILGNAVHWAKPVNMRTTSAVITARKTTEQRYQAGEKRSVLTKTRTGDRLSADRPFFVLPCASFRPVKRITAAVLRRDGPQHPAGHPPPPPHYPAGTL